MLFRASLDLTIIFFCFLWAIVTFRRHLDDASDGTGYSISYLHEITSWLVNGNDKKEALGMAMQNLQMNEAHKHI